MSDTTSSTSNGCRFMVGTVTRGADLGLVTIGHAMSSDGQPGRPNRAYSWSVAFVPDDFDVPEALDLGWARLRPLRVEDNDGDFAAWQASIDHIRSTPGFEG